MSDRAQARSDILFCIPSMHTQPGFEIHAFRKLDTIRLPNPIAEKHDVLSMKQKNTWSSPNDRIFP